MSGTTLSAIAKRPDLWPREVTLKTAVATADKKVPSIPAGAAAKVVGLEGPLIGVEYGGALAMVPVAQTDFLERATGALASAPPASAASAPVSAPGKEASLTGKLESALVQLNGSGQFVRLPASGGSDALAAKKYVLLQLGGGRRFASAMTELNEAVRNARARNVNFAHVLVPRPGETPEAAIQLVRESGFSGPIVDPREHGLVTQLWTQYGHSGPFALAFLDARGRVISQTIPTARGVDKFHSVLGDLAQATTPVGVAAQPNAPAASGEVLQAKASPPSPAASAQGQEPDPDETRETPNTAPTVFAAARAAFHKKNFAELSAIADRVTRERSLSRTARAELEDVFAAITAEEPKRPDIWTAYLETFDQWVAASPGSPAAQVAKAGAWISYAWLARGHGYAQTVTAEGWKLFEERIAKARKILEETKATAAPRCPHWYATMLTIARAQNWSREETMALAQEGIAAAAWYHPIYHAAITYLLPRWHGKPGEWQEFARRAADSVGPQEGPFLYACLTGRAQVNGEELFLTPTPVDWPRLRAGYEQLVARYPNPQLWRQFCQLACLAGDRTKAREAFAHTSFTVSFRPWHNEGEVAAWKAWSEGAALPLQRAREEKVFELWKEVKKEQQDRRAGFNAT